MIHSWERQPDESAKAFEGFCIYRDLGPSRSISQVVRKSGKSKALFERWSVQYEWVKRSEMYDSHLELTARKNRETEHLKAIEAYRTRQREVAVATVQASLKVLQKSSDRLKSLAESDISPAMLPAYFRVVAVLAEVGLRGESESLAVDQLLQILDERI